MQKKLVPAALALIAASGLASASWSSRGDSDPSSPASAASGETRDVRGHRLDRWATVLKLTDDQKAQIKALFDAERSAMKPQFQALKDVRRDLHKATEGGTFDEAAVRALAQKQAQAQAELTVERARGQSKVLAVLTPDQQNLLKSLLPLLRPEGRHGGLGML